MTFSHLFLFRNRVLHHAPHKKADDFCYLLFYFEEFVGLTEPDEAKLSNGFGGFPYVLSEVLYNCPFRSEAKSKNVILNLFQDLSKM